MDQSASQYWLWIATIVTAVIGGILSLYGSMMQNGKPGAGGRKGFRYYVVISSYVFMSISVLLFALRGLLR